VLGLASGAALAVWTPDAEGGEEQGIEAWRESTLAELYAEAAAVAATDSETGSGESAVAAPDGQGEAH
jgi:hypothetical protein